MDASTDPEEIRRWWATWPGANVGLATGRGLVVLDVDPRHGGDEALAELEARHGALPETVIAESGGGGEHYYLRGDWSIKCSEGKDGGKLPRGLDIRAGGGYTVAAPSLHVSGRRYEWINPPGEHAVADLPAWLSERLAEPEGARAPQPASTWQSLAGGVGEGERNAAAAKLYGYLLARRVDAVLARELLVGWDAKFNRPPLGRDELERVCESIAGRERRKYV